MAIVKLLQKLFIGILLFIPLTSYAVSYDELKSDTNSYKFIGANEDDDFYLNKNSIQIIRYQPPYYSIKATIYIANPSRDAILEKAVIFNYNTEKNLKYYIDEAIDKVNPNEDDNSIIKETTSNLMEKLNVESGVTMTALSWSLYKLNGVKDIRTNKSKPAIKVPYFSALFEIANEAFAIAYKVKFSDIE